MKNKKLMTLRILIIAAVLMAASFIAVLMIEKSALEDKSVYVSVVAAATDIPAGTKITENNVSEYFTIISVPESTAVAEALTDKSSAVGYTVMIEMKANEQLTQARLFSVNDETVGLFENPVQVSLATDSLAEAVSGTLRAGDVVNIVAYSDVSTKEIGVVMENVYVSGVYDTTGNEVTSDGTAATVFTFMIEEEDYLDFVNATTLGGVQIIKVGETGTTTDATTETSEAEVSDSANE